MEQIKKKYEEACKEQGLLFRHLPYLLKLSAEVKEEGGYICGYGDGSAVWPLLHAGCSPILAVDKSSREATEQKELAKDAGMKIYTRKKEPAGYVPREAPFGITILNTVREGEELLAELSTVAEFTAKYIAINYTAYRYEREGKRYSAIQKFLRSGAGWRLRSHTEALHGFTVLEKF